MSERPLRVVQVVNNLHCGGLERVVQDLVLGFPPDQVESHLVPLEYPGRYAESLTARATLHPVPRMSRFSMLYPSSLVGLAKAIQPDVWHTHTGVWYKGASAARAAGVPAIVHTDHGRPVPDPLLTRLLERRGSVKTDVVVAVSDSVAELLRDRVVGSGTRIAVIPNGVDPARFRPRDGTESLRGELGIGPEVPLIGSIGRLVPVKNYQLAIRALAQVAAPGGNLERAPLLLLAGDGPDRSSLEQLAGDLGLSQRVYFLGWRDDVHRFFDTIDLFTLSSVSEGTSMSLLEAMSTGLCSVVTDVGGNRSVMGQELAMNVVPSGDVGALAHAWSRNLEDPTERRRLGLVARQRVSTCFSVRRMATRYLELYREILSKGTHSPASAG